MNNSVWTSPEKQGSGFIRIRKEIKSYPTMIFSLEAAPNGLLTAFSQEQQKVTKELNVTKNFTENFTENRTEKIINPVNINNRINTEEQAVKPNLNKRTILRDIELLKKQKKLIFKHPAKGGY